MTKKNKILNLLFKKYEPRLKKVLDSHGQAFLQGFDIATKPYWHNKIQSVTNCSQLKDTK